MKREGGSEPPHATVIVCTRDRESLLEEQLAVLFDESEPENGAVSFEVIYVNDGSEDGTSELLDRWARAQPRLTCLRTEGVGPAAARNRGVERARGAFLLFIDDDAVPPARWVEAMLNAQQKWDCGVVCGGIGPYSLETRAERYLHHRMQLALGRRPRLMRAAPSGNLLVRRELFEQAGGFDEELRAAEDWDLTLRLRDAGAVIRYVPSVTVRHRYQRDWSCAEERIKAMGRAGVQVARKRGRPLALYAAHSVLRAMLSPIWALWRFPLDLCPAAVSMEMQFAAARLAACLGRRFPQSLL